MKEAFELLDSLVKDWRQGKIISPEGLIELNRNLIGTYSYLQTIRSNFHFEWQQTVEILVNGGDSVARAENKAHVKYPELYTLRKKLDAYDKVIWAVSQEISYLKHEKSHVSQT